MLARLAGTGLNIYGRYACVWRGKPAILGLANGRIAIATGGLTGQALLGDLGNADLKMVDATAGTFELNGVRGDIRFTNSTEPTVVVDAIAAAKRQAAVNALGYPPELIGRIVLNCEYAGGHNIGVQRSARVDLVFTDGALEIHHAAAAGGPALIRSVPFGEHSTLEVGGPGEVVSGGGFSGGGIGLVGAAEGMLIAGFLNAVTTKRTVTSVIAYGDIEHEGFFVKHDVRPEELRARLSFAFVGLRAIKAAHQAHLAAHTSPPTGGDFLARLERLAALHNAGALTDDEFALGKAKLLADDHR